MLKADQEYLDEKSNLLDEINSFNPGGTDVRYTPNAGGDGGFGIFQLTNSTSSGIMVTPTDQSELFSSATATKTAVGPESWTT